MDVALWQAFERDPQAGLAAIYDRHAALAYGIALSILRERQAAEDLVQEVFVTLFQRRGYDPDRGSLAAFVSTITRSRAIDRLRGQARRARALERFGAEPGPVDDRITPFERMSTMERSRKVVGALAELSERQRRVLELAYFRGLSQAEIAAELGAPLGTVKSTTRAALRSLRSSLGSGPS